MIVRFSHVGHAVRNIDEVIEMYERLFDLHPAYRLTIPELGLKNAMFPIGNNFLELIEPLDSTSFIAQFLDKRGPGLYHINLIVDDIDNEIRLLKERGAQLIIIEPPDLPFKNVWIHPSSTGGVLYELGTEEMATYLFEKCGGKA